MQKTLAFLCFIIVFAFFSYSVYTPDYLIRITAWSNRLIGWNWPTERDRTLFRIAAALGALAVGAGMCLLITGRS